MNLRDWVTLSQAKESSLLRAQSHASSGLQTPWEQGSGLGNECAAVGWSYKVWVTV